MKARGGLREMRAAESSRGVGQSKELRRAGAQVPKGGDQDTEVILGQ